MLGQPVGDVEAVVSGDKTRRDKLDSEREISPLKKADDALEIDTTSLTIDEVAEKILQIVDKKAQK